MANRPQHRQISNPADTRPDLGPEMVRSEEQVRVGTQVRWQAGRCCASTWSLRPSPKPSRSVTRRCGSITRLPPSADAVQATTRAPFDHGAAVEMVLYQEVPRVPMEVVAMERIRLHTDNVAPRLRWQRTCAPNRSFSTHWTCRVAASRAYRRLDSAVIPAQVAGWDR